MISVIIVEDDPMVAEINKSFVEEISSFKVVAIVPSVEDAIRILKKNKIDLMLLDIYLPEVEGTELLKEIRREDIDIDVILVTAASDSQRIEKALRYGAIDYIIKPFRKERLQNSLRKYLRVHSTLKAKKKLSQNEIDTISLKAIHLQETQLPKNLSKITLEKVLKYLIEHHPISATQASKELGITRVSIQKYLDYLVEIGVACKDLKYGNRGRPLQLYYPRSPKTT